MLLTKIPKKFRAVILAILTLLSVGLFAVAPAALAGPSGCSTNSTYDANTGQCVPNTASTTSGSSTSTLDQEACKNFSGSQQTDCQNCRAQGTSCLVCHPEYNFGTALTTAELTSCQNCNQPGSNNDHTKTCLQQNQLVTRLNQIINIVAGIASIVIVGMLIFSGIRYSMAGSPQQAAEAKKHISNVFIALVVLVFMWGFLQWILPGGL